MKYMLSLTFGIIFCLTLTAQNTPRTILWEIRQPNSPFVSYLFGTFHEVDPAFFAALHTAVDKLKSSDVVYVEETSGASTAANTSLSTLYTWNKIRWDSLLKPEQEPVFQNFINRAERNDFFNLPPLVLYRAVSGMYFMDFCGSETRQSYEFMDTYVEKLARQNGKPVRSLDENQVYLLQAAALKSDTTRNSIYAQYCTDLMHKMLQDDTSGCVFIAQYKNFGLDYQLDMDLTSEESVLLTERNNRWLSMLQPVLKTRNCFIAVGFRHLFYKQGLIRQLQEMGYSVTPVTLP